jgi:hypothetical protein
METIVDITDKKQITGTFNQIVSFPCQRLTKIMNIAVSMVAIAFCTKRLAESVQVPTFTWLAQQMLAGGDLYKSRPHHSSVLA